VPKGIVNLGEEMEKRQKEKEKERTEKKVIVKDESVKKRLVSMNSVANMEIEELKEYRKSSVSDIVRGAIHSFYVSEKDRIAKQKQLEKEKLSVSEEMTKRLQEKLRKKIIGEWVQNEDGGMMVLDPNNEWSQC